MSLTLRIPRELVSPNRWNGRHWSVKHALSRQWEHDIFFMLPVGTPDTTVKQRVLIVRAMPSTRRFIKDPDNLMAACKPLLDALVRLGLLKDDSSVWCQLETPGQIVSADKGVWTVIQIEPCER